MAFHRYAQFEVLASGIADATGSLPADVTRVGGTGTAFTKSAHRHNFVYDPKPGYLYVRSRAISSRTNDNFDTFPAHAIKAAWRTFIGKPVFVNHHNANHRRMRGVIIDAALHEDIAPDGSLDVWTEVLMEVDAVRFPKLAEAVVKGWIDRTSMGTEVALSTCSFCGNQAANPTEYCRHIPAMKGQRIIRTEGTRREAVLVSEICEGLHFFENSLLVEPPADPTAFTFGLDTRGLAAEKATAHLAKVATPKTAGLARVVAEMDAEEPDLDDFTDFEIIEAEALLAKQASMCSECNPDLKAAGVTALCAPHGYQVKARANVGRSSGDALAPAAKTAAAGDPEWLINGVPYFPGRWIEVEPGTWYRGTESPEIPARMVVSSKDGEWVWEARILTFIGAPHEGKNPTGKAKTLEAAQAKAEASIAKDNEAFAKYDARMQRLLRGDGMASPNSAQMTAVRKIIDGVAKTAAGIYGPVKDDHLGRCYELSGRRVAFGPDDSMISGYRNATLVHGTIQGFNNPAIGHAWVEEPDGSVWEPATDTVYPADAFKALFKPVVHHRYSTREARMMMLEHEHYGPWEGPNAVGSKTALGETRAPAQVDTLRMDACPVCGDDDGFDGTRCRVCQFVKPPAMFDDPDVEKAKQVDLRGGDVENAEDPTAGGGEQLQCDHCGKTYPLENEPKAVDTTKPGAGATQPEPADKPAKGKPPVPPKKAPGVATTSAFNPDPDEVQQGVQPESGFGEEPEAPKTDGPLADGATCPSCGTGVLHVAPAAAAQSDAITPDAGPDGLSEDVPVDGQPNPAVDDAQQQDPTAQPGDEQQPPEQGEPGTEPGQQDPADNPVHPDHGAPVVAPEGEDAPDKTKPEHSEDDAEDEDEDGDEKGKSAPPWAKKKAASHRAGSQSKERVDMGNPAQQGRNRLLEALRAQQSMITAQDAEIKGLKRAMATMAKAAGIGSHPHFASLVKSAADEEKNPVATTDEQALKPDAKDDPESIGAAPSSANTGVTPDATTDVANTNVSLPAEPLNNLVDVTAPTGGTDVPKGDAAHVETDVKVTAPSTEPFPNNSGWKQSSVEDPQVRFMASLRLAEARKAAGTLEPGIEHVTAAQRINDDTNLSLAVIQHEINTLAAVASVRQAPAQQVQAAARSLVPQRAEVPRTMPSLSAQGSTGVQPVGQSNSAVAAAQVRDSLI